MNRNLGIGILTLCFGLSSVNVSLAVQAVAISPVVVQPYDPQELNQQMLNRDRQNRDEEIAIQGLVEENNKLTQGALAHQQDEGLAKINQTMLSYRNALFSRDQARIMANSERRPSRYGDLIVLTENADAMTENRGDLENKSGLLAQKYQMLTELKDEMIVLNDKLRGEEADKFNQKEAIIEGYKKIAQEQQDKIQILVGRLDEMDRKISRFNEIIAQKDRQIAHLKDNLAMVQKEASSKDESIRWLNQVLAIAKSKAEYYKLTSQLDQITARQVSQNQTQVDLLKSELEKKIKELSQANTLSAQMTLLMSDYQKKLESRNSAYNEQLRQVLSFNNDRARMKGQIADLNVRLQEKEAEVVKIKKDMYDLQGPTAANRDLQAKDLSLFMVQQKMMEKKTKEYQEDISGMPRRDQIRLLRTRLKKATLQLRQKDAMLLQMKADADEYAKEFREQSLEFQSFNLQLQKANEEITRLKKRSTK